MDELQLSIISAVLQDLSGTTNTSPQATRYHYQKVPLVPAAISTNYGIAGRAHRKSAIVAPDGFLAAARMAAQAKVIGRQENRQAGS